MTGTTESRRLTAGIDVGSSSAKIVIMRHEGDARRSAPRRPSGSGGATCAS